MGMARLKELQQLYVSKTRYPFIDNDNVRTSCSKMKELIAEEHWILTQAAGYYSAGMAQEDEYLAFLRHIYSRLNKLFMESGLRSAETLADYIYMNNSHVELLTTCLTKPYLRDCIPTIV